MELIRSVVRLILVCTLKGADLSDMYLYLEQNRTLLGEVRYLRVLSWLAAQELERDWQTDQTKVC